MPPRLFIHQDKLTKYLMNASHHKGGPKARFFMAHGFRLNDLDALAAALAHHVIDHWPGSLVPSSWGERHEVIGPMALPDGTTRDVLAIWEIRHGETTANFITAYPQ